MIPIVISNGWKLNICCGDDNEKPPKYFSAQKTHNEIKTIDNIWTKAKAVKKRLSCDRPAIIVLPIGPNLWSVSSSLDCWAICCNFSDSRESVFRLREAIFSYALFWLKTFWALILMFILCEKFDIFCTTILKEIIVCLYIR